MFDQGRLTLQQLPGEFQYGTHLGRWFPFGIFQHAKTHGARVWGCIIGDVRVIDLRGERHRWWFEGIIGREGNIESKMASLHCC